MLAPAKVKRFGMAVAQEQGLPGRQIKPFLGSVSVFLALDYIDQNIPPYVQACQPKNNVAYGGAKKRIGGIIK